MDADEAVATYEKAVATSKCEWPKCVSLGASVECSDVLISTEPKASDCRFTRENAQRRPATRSILLAPHPVSDHVDKAGHTFYCNPDPTSVFDPSSVLRFGAGPAHDSVPIRFYSRPVRNSLPHPAFNPDFVTSHNSDLDEARSKC
ncbi:hypothetical protein EVAR_40109_1 [Eumeta japonica]|uniref:Uncharacterized protein n=1 Tax=Eumeta variegata TaxID=151549 RepID=A0A4C1W944_EUMVA|nr:hypothetical protein EVAR_40109_1 [Eumeta japonica]